MERERRVTNEASIDLCLRFQMLFVFVFFLLQFVVQRDELSRDR